MDITIDIETIPTQSRKVADLVRAKVKAPANYKDPMKIQHYIIEHAQEALDKTALTPCGEIVAIGAALDDEEPFVFQRIDDDSNSEKILIGNWIDWLSSLDEPGRPAVPRFIGHNLIGFDIPRLWQRATVYGLMLPSYFPAPWEVSKWRPHGAVLDTMYCFSPEQPLPLEMLAALFDVETRYPELKEEGRPVTGADVYALWIAAQDDTIKAYCAEDVRVTREVATRFMA